MSLMFGRPKRRYSELIRLRIYLEEIAICIQTKPLLKLYKLGNTP